ncbi:hypothetical protein AN396_04070 [Candidatus Epulonipiscium fishelsonii]|uniref:Uncharacterized protein n=1 Tax=Candidatus Epulonipiscium fishelsonii TaxID=77094 RepID=A0ACC8XEA8_9FIRM|nr:hypothetical protein AN396_04070 [Epulopiscium sp. SCG-B11WGA-EpuloA1]
MANNFALIADAFFLAPSREISIIYALGLEQSYRVCKFIMISLDTDMGQGALEKCGFLNF